MLYIESWFLSESIQTSPWLDSYSVAAPLRSTYYEREVTGSLVLSWRSVLLGRFSLSTVFVWHVTSNDFFQDPVGVSV